MTDHIPTKSVVTVKEMASLVALSRARFYQLVAAGVFPAPVYSVSNRRPIYVESLQEVCLEVRRRGLGINGKPVLFYGKGHRPQRQSKPPRKTVEQSPTGDRHAHLLTSLRALGLTTVKEEQVEAALKTVFPDGVDGEDQGAVIRAVFLHLRQQLGSA
jgi:hypothetical protein